MKKIIRLTEQDLARIVRRVIKEEKEESTSKKINLAFESAKKMYEMGQTNDDIEQEIKDCITSKRLTSLGILTTAAGGYALGVIAIAMSVPGINLIAGSALAISSIVTILVSEFGLVGGQKLSDDIGKLFDCLF
jgi:hypothetical protein